MHQAGVSRKAPTSAEARLWAFLRAGRLRGVGFRRQHAIGPYVVDFCAPRHHLVIEVDGAPHAGLVDNDATRTMHLEARGYRVLRLWNHDILNDIDAIGRAILDSLRIV